MKLSEKANAIHLPMGISHTFGYTRDGKSVACFDGTQVWLQDNPSAKVSALAIKRRYYWNIRD